MWQVEIVDTVTGQWDVWTHIDLIGGYDRGNLQDAKRAERIASGCGWKTRIVEIG